MEKSNNREKGQIIVIMVIGVVMLVAFVGLAVDSSMVYSNRRYDQNVADSASLAGAAAASAALVGGSLGNCGSSEAITAITAAENAAIASAAANNVTLDTDISDGHGVSVTCSTDNGGYMDISVLITSSTKPAFAQMVFSNNLTTTSESVTRMEIGGPVMLGNGIVALNDECEQLNSFSGEGGVRVNGNITVNMDTGGIFSNACLMSKGNSATINSPGGITYVSVINDGHDIFQPSESISQTGTLLEYLGAPTPDCGSVPDYTGQDIDSSGTYDPGYYDSMSLNGNPDIILNPGLYCFQGDVSGNNGSLTVSGDNELGVTFALLNGEFNLAGNVEVNIRAPMVDSLPAVKGLLIYLPETNFSDVFLHGTSDWNLRGTVYAPSSDIDVTGDSGTHSINAQLIGDSVHIQGNGTIDISFTNGMVISDSGDLSLYK